MGLTPLEFFDQALTTYQASAASTPTRVECRLDLAGDVLHLRVAGDALGARLTRSLSHLEVPGTRTASVTIFAWDDVSTPARMPPPPWGTANVYTRRGDLRGFGDDRILAAYNFGAGTLSLFDVERRAGLFWVRDPSVLPGYELAAPFRVLLHWVARATGGHLVHGAAVGTPHGGVLLVGRGGSGKSTTALACLAGGLFYVGDDYCLVRLGPPFVHSLYCSAKVWDDSVRQLPQLQAAAAPDLHRDGEKAVFVLDRRRGDRILPGCPLRAILLPRVTGAGPTRLRPATPREALQALAPSTMAQLAGADARSVAIMTALARQLPCYHLELGSDLPEIPPVIVRLLAELS